MTVASNLPLLNDDDLELLFHNDPDGARRYRVLHGVLVRGMTQHEAATEMGVSERTVRNVLRAYGRSGSLEVLRSRGAAGRRRSRRASEAEEALAEALAAEPLAGGDRLWRRAQELLGPAGGQLSRRTAYRILSQLRARARQSAPAGLAVAVRKALPLLQEDPPLTLGSGALAQRLVPDEPDQLARGRVLRQGLRQAIERLRPAGGQTGVDRGWWPYLICVGEYEEERNRADLQRELALSASTYSRAKRQALDRIAASLPQIVAQLTVTSAAAVLQPLPRTPDFVGRHEEQTYYAWRLRTEGLAQIWGLPGSGKTVLAAELAAAEHRYGRRVLWHTCTAGREATLAGVARSIAQALGGVPDDTLQLDAPQDALALLESLRARLAAEHALIVLDDVERLDPADAGLLVAALTDLVSAQAARLMLVGRCRPDLGDWPALPGLYEEEARLLWGSAQSFPEEQWRTLYASVAGLPQPIRLAAAVYRRAGDLARLSDWSGALEAWAEDAIWNQSDADERRLLAAVSLLESRASQVTPAAACRELGLNAAVLARLHGRGLLPDDDGTPVLPVLQTGAAMVLREDAELRAAVERLTAEPRSAVEAKDVAPAPENAAVAAPSEGLELLERLHRVLSHSTAYLRSKRDDREASRLARELAMLQEVLPRPEGHRTRSSSRTEGRRGRMWVRHVAPRGV